MAYWLFKTEPVTYGFDRLEREGRTEWSGVRNYQARNNMIAMKKGDLGFFYHSSIAEPAIVGICEVSREAYPDFTARDPASPYYDPKATDEKPIWQMVDVTFVKALPRAVTLAELRKLPRFSAMPLLQRGMRLSVQPVSPRHWKLILALAGAA